MKPTHLTFINKKARLTSGLLIYIGGVSRKIVEHSLSTIRLYVGTWTRDKIEVDQETLARLKKEDGLTNVELAQRLGIGLTSVKLKLYVLDRTGNRIKTRG